MRKFKGFLNVLTHVGYGIVVVASAIYDVVHQLILK